VTAVVAGFLISAIGGSRVQIGGPTGAFIVVVFSVIAEHGMGGLLSATFMAGVILIVAGYLRVGRLMRIIPEAVIEGFTIGIALIIAASQFRWSSGSTPGTFRRISCRSSRHLGAARRSASRRADRADDRRPDRRVAPSSRAFRA
jgi:SulP family sulfate permease